ncbi:MAG: hypothetical protein QOI03_389 [Solirubrobacteraceae bacterium]|nr:hypothetical protein [Solirubrobacteraceae bacterium]
MQRAPVASAQAPDGPPEGPALAPEAPEQSPAPAATPVQASEAAGPLPPPEPEIAPAPEQPIAQELGAPTHRTQPQLPRSGRGSFFARPLALVALVAVVVAVVLLVRSLSGSSRPPAAALPRVVKVLIPEGQTRIQIARLAAADGLKGSYRGASKRSPLLSPVSFGAPRGTPDLEGFLFPATYDMDSGAPVTRLVQEQLIAFRENFGPAEIARARALHVTPYQLLIVASMIEREAQVASDRPKIAAVIYNRLRDGMPLGIDATLYYAIELRTGVATYTRELTQAQLQMNSVYNTRTHGGLPPTPIANPGVASIRAAAHPARVSYLYYVLATDGCGDHVFSTTLAAFEANATAYRTAVAKNGGRPLACKRK